jgi:hypothetical protein
MTIKTGPFKRVGRRVYDTLMALSVVAIAAGCATTERVPVTVARPTGDGVRLRVQPPFDSASKGSRFMTLYGTRMKNSTRSRNRVDGAWARGCGRVVSGLQ